MKSAKLNLGSYIFLLGFSVYFCLPFMFPVDRTASVLGTTRYFYANFAIILAGAAWGALPTLRSLPRRMALWTTGMGVVTLIMAFLGLSRGQPSDDVAAKIAPYIALIFCVLLAKSERLWKTLNPILVLHAWIGIMFFTYTVFATGISFRSDLYALEGFTALTGSMYAFTFLLMTFVWQKRAGQAAGLIGFCAQSLLFLMLWLKITLVLIPSNLLAFVVVLSKSRGPQMVQLRRRAKLSIASMLALMVLGGFILIEQGQTEWVHMVDRGIQGTLERFALLGEGTGDLAQEDRWGEMQVVTSQMSPLDWIIGKGASATWQDVTLLYEGEDRPVIHFSYFDYVFRGGVGLLILMLIPLKWAWGSFKRAPDALTIGCAACVFISYLKMASYGQAAMSLEWILVSLCIGRCFWMTQASDKTFATRSYPMAESSTIRATSPQP